MSVHLSAKPGDVAPTVLLPGDPLRARFIAERFLTDATCYSQVRGMLGFTGTFHGRPVSVQGTGMGMPSLSIYAHELMAEYGARLLIRIGTCGSIQPGLTVGHLILAQSASTDSAMNQRLFGGLTYAPTADFGLLARAATLAANKGLPHRVGNVFTSDTFYDETAAWQVFARHGTLAVEMETAALYTLAARLQARALSILTVSDEILTGVTTSSEARERAFTDMMQLALAVIEAELAQGDAP